MKIAIIGTGIAGNLVANRLAREHEITVFEADGRIGGHTNTVEVEDDGRTLSVDTGFIVYNNRTYPNFIQLLDELGVVTQPSDMSFSVRSESNGLEYCGNNLNTLFAQRRNLFRPSFYRMLSDILRFNREAPGLLGLHDDKRTLNQFLTEGNYSSEFVEHYIVPMGAAIWSATPDGMGGVPAGFFVRFFHNHGLLSIGDRPQWRVISGGSQSYVKKLVAGHLDRVRLNTPVQWVRRHASGVEIRTGSGESERFDYLFVACHSDQALDLLSDASEPEREVLGAIAYQRNEAVLHTDTTLLPRKSRAWASWNYHIPQYRREDAPVALTYHMNRLQNLDSCCNYCVTLNHTEAINPDKIIRTVDYSHPIFNEAAVAAQQRHREINGTGHTYYCGAYWRYGFHEDGVVSAQAALNHFERDVRSSRTRAA